MRKSDFLGLMMSLWLGCTAAAQHANPSASQTTSIHPQVIHWLEQERELEVDRQIAAARRIGLRKDRLQTRHLLAWLSTAPEVGGKVGLGFDAPIGYHRYVAVMTALGRVGDPKAIPELKELEPRFGKNPFFRTNFARLQVEAQYGVPVSEAQWRAKMQAYLQLVGVSLEELASHFQNTPIYNRVRSGEAPWLELLVARHLVEMASEAYECGVRTAFAPLAMVSYKSDPVCALRAELAEVAPERRVSWLVGRILKQEVVDVPSCYLVQALVDCGAEAVPAILQAIERMRDLCTPRTLLLWALSAIEFEQGCPSVAQLRSHDSPAVAKAAQQLFEHPLVVRTSDW